MNRIQTPLVARSSLVQQVLTAVTTDRGAVVVGQRGTGRTTLVELVTRHLSADRYAVTRTTATEAARPIPFGLFGQLFPVSGDPALVPGRIRAELVRRGRSRTPLLVVEDAHWIDDRSANTLLGLAHDGRVRLMVTTRSDTATPDAVVALWKDRHLRRVDLPPLDPTETATLTQAMLGHAVASTTAQLVYQWTGGNPRLATELVRHGSVTGRMVHDRGLWWWRGQLSVPPHLVELFLPEPNRLTPAHRDALAAVAVSDDLPIELVDRIAPDAVEELEDLNLLRTTDTDDGVAVGFGHPLLQAIVWSQVSPARRRRVASALVEAAHQSGHTTPDPATVARWQLAVGAPVATRALTDAARQLRPHAPEQALRLARVAFGRDRSARAAVLLADALAEVGSGREAQSVLHQATASDRSPTGRVLLSAALALHRCVTERDPASAHADLRALRAVASTTGHDAIDGADATVLLIGQRPADAARVADRLLHRLPDAGAVSHSALRCRIVRTMALALLGRTDEAAVAGAAVLADARGQHARPPDTAGLASAVLSLIGLWRDGSAPPTVTDPVLGRWPRLPGKVPGTGLRAVDWPLLAGYARLLRGEYPAAIPPLREALAQQSVGFRLFRSEASAWLAVSLAATGRPDDAQQVLDADPPDRLAVLPGLRPWADGAVAAARGDTRSAGRRLEAAVAAAHAAGCWSIELQYLTWAAQLPPADQPVALADRLTRCIRHVEAGRLVAEARGELALSDSDPTGLLQQATRLAELGLPRRAWRLAEAAAARASPGRDQDHAAAVALAGRLRTALGVPAPNPASPALTIRETEVAALAASGLANREIATRLVVSARTVESHLARVYRKLGIGSRRDLRTHWFDSLPVGGGPGSRTTPGNYPV
ncbi:helix-turn-helix transcriptional regulator [Plantactinospora endophytica]|uniref:LuxR family transcriptional regulator n=1 Tax=Plantactinospora endophytica TaxID=673535 RepID=A0ABQ4E2H0_9ACTN|nr:LuxR family transcriptional regulator [Plantactinospora endophytica]GIG88562.1 LuxR family transcriptional regulator [Plantactinospora endophytica]